MAITAEKDIRGEDQTNPSRHLILWSPLSVILVIIGIILSVALGCLSTLKNALLGKYASAILSTETDQGQPQRIQDLLTQAVHLALLTWTVGFGVSFFWKLLGQSIRDELEQKLLESTLQASQEWKSRNSYTSRLNQWINVDIAKIEELIAWKIGLIPQHIATFVYGIYTAFSTSLQLSLIIMVTFPLVGVVLNFMHREMGKQESILLESYRRASSHLHQVFQCIETVSDFGQQKRELESYTKTLSASRFIQRRKSLISGFGWGLYGGVMLFGYAIAFLAGGHLVSNGLLSPGDVISVFSNIAVGITALGNLGTSGNDIGLLSQLYSSISSALHDLYDHEQKDSSTISTLIMNSNISISFSNLSYSYSGTSKVIYRNLSLTLPPGEVICLMGPSGCGKSTMFSLLTRFYEKYDGLIRIGGVNIRDMPISELGSKVAIVRSASFLFHGTLRDNLGLLSSTSMIGDDALIDVCKAVCIWDRVEALPNRFATPMPDILASWSGGEKQRLVLARYLLVPPPVLILDESTSALDPETEQRVLSGLLGRRRKMGLLTILVTHRLNVLKNHATYCVLLDRVKDSDGCEACQVLYQGSPLDAPFPTISPLSSAPLQDKSGEDMTLSIARSKRTIPEDIRNLSHPSPSINKHKLSFWQQQQALWLLIRLHKGTLYVICGMIGAIMEGIRPPVEGYLIGKVVEGYGLPRESAERSSFIYSAGMLYMGLHAIVAATLFQGGFGYLGADLAYFVRQYVFDHLLEQPSLLHPESGYQNDSLLPASASEWELRLSTHALEVERLGGPFWAEIMRSILITSGALVICFSESPLFTVMIIGCCACTGGFLSLLQKLLDFVQRHEASARSIYRTTLSDWIHWFPEITQHDRQDLFLKWYKSRLLKPLQRTRLWVRVVESFQYSIVDSLIVILFSTALFIATLLIRHDLYFYGRLRVDLVDSRDEASVGNALVVLMTMVMTCVQGLPVINGVFYILGPLQLRIQPLLDILHQQLIQSDSAVDDHGVLFPVENPCLQGGVEVVIRGLNVQVSTTVILHDLDLNILPAQVVAIVGATGSGKSTLLNSIASNDLKKQFASSTSLSKSIVFYTSSKTRVTSCLTTIVRQSPQFFNRSLRENILYGISESSTDEKRLNEKLLEILDIVGLKGVVQSLPQGLETLMGEKGHVLSSGQLQRVALARALILHDKPILLLDEAMSALNSQLEEEILLRLIPFCQQRNQTIVMVTHHERPTRLCDRVLVLKEGKIVADGTPANVRQSSQEFQKIFLHDIK